MCQLGEMRVCYYNMGRTEGLIERHGWHSGGIRSAEKRMLVKYLGGLPEGDDIGWRLS